MVQTVKTGLRNPTLIVPPGAVMHVLLVNTDGDMPHDIHFGQAATPFSIAPDTRATVGTAKLPPEKAGRFSGQELSLRAGTTGSFVYFCSVRGHAKGGMWGTIAVGTAPAKTTGAMNGATSMNGADSMNGATSINGADSMTMPDKNGVADAMAGMNHGDDSMAGRPGKGNGSMPMPASNGADPMAAMPAVKSGDGSKTGPVPDSQTRAIPRTQAPAGNDSMAGMPGMDRGSDSPAPGTKSGISSTTQTPVNGGPMAAMPGMKSDSGSMAAMPGMDHGNGSMTGMAMGAMMMRSTIDLRDPMSRESSGTAWLPDSSPIYAKMKMQGQRMLMFHGDLFPRYTRVGSKRDVSIAGQGSRSRLDAPSMFMAMASQPAGKRGQIGVRLMTSLDPLIEQGYGYPLLYQSGESYRGQPIHDRQHPHDLVSELSATYSRTLGQGSSAYLYLGYPGEPALGPPTFMHRLSAMDSPDAPISHHWQDATHITFGVATLGLSRGRVKIEASAFKGEEPNENRYNFDTPRLDSLAGRLSWNPTRNLALQVSHGFLKRPEPAEPDVLGRHRTTASVIFNKPLGRDANWANTFVWGQNLDAQEDRSNSYLLETNLQRGASTVYARAEQVQKSGHELVLAGPLADGLFGVSATSIGFVRDLKRNGGLDVGLGAQVTFNTNPSALDAVYGGGSHTGFEVFLRIRPSRLREDEAMTAANGAAMPMPQKSGK